MKDLKLSDDLNIDIISDDDIVYFAGSDGYTYFSLIKYNKEITYCLNCYTGVRSNGIDVDDVHRLKIIGFDDV